MTYQLHHGNCIDIMPLIERESVDAVICDPPYGLSFMGKDWDHGVPGEHFWREAYRCVKPGAYLLAFGGDRTHHRLMVAIEDAGWEIRTCIYWIFGQGFPKSRNAGKAMVSELSEDALCACDHHSTETVQDSSIGYQSYLHSGDAQLHEDRGSGLNAFPSRADALLHTHDDQHRDDLALEQANTSLDATSARHSSGDYPYPLAHHLEDFQSNDSTQSDILENTSRDDSMGKRKTDSRIPDKSSLDSDLVSSSPDSPLTHSDIPYCTTCGKLIASYWDGWGTALKPAAEIIIVARKPLQGTVAENVQRYGTGAMNIDACRIETDWATDPTRRGWQGNRFSDGSPFAAEHKEEHRIKRDPNSAPARWPANIIHDGSAEVLAGFPMTTSGARVHNVGDTNTATRNGIFSNAGPRRVTANEWSGDTGSAARFFYCAKASKADRDEGLEGFVPVIRNDGRDESLASGDMPQNRSNNPDRNHHPTVKPTALMRYLCRLVTPPNGTILDPFMGSGSTGKAAMLEGFNFIGIDTEIEYVEIAARRIEHACEKVGIVIEQPMMFETQRETVDRPKQLILL